MLKRINELLENDEINKGQWARYIGLLFVVSVASVIMLGVFFYSGYRWYDFKNNGSVTRAVILKKNPSGGSNSEYQLSYFSDSLRTRLNSDQNHGNVGDSIDIYYFRDKRGVAFYSEVTSAHGVKLTGGITIFIFVVLLGVYYFPAQILRVESTDGD